MNAPRALYVHVPFCARRCHYCDFAVTRRSRPPVAAYLEAIGRELDLWRAERGRDDRPALDTIFVGGGTPSLIGGDGMRGLATLLADHFTWDPRRVEWTAEANPNSLDDSVLAAWREVGVNRVSIGVQSFLDGPLRWLGRLHDAEEAVAAVDRAQRAGFERVSVDLIFALPDDVARDWQRDVHTALALGVTHVSAYGLTAEPQTPLGRWVDLGRVRMPAEDRYGDEYLEVADALASAGFEHYEVSNFARPGHESRHNWHYWDGAEYLGVGPSAHSYVGGERRWNVRRWEDYRRAVGDADDLRVGRERPDAAQRHLERVWLGLRTARGVPWSEVGRGPHDTRVASWRGAGWVRSNPASLCLTPEGWLRLDLLAADVAGWRDEKKETAEEVVA